MTDDREITPPPGSQQAIDAGCTCPVIDNRYGQGWGDPPEYWVDIDCPIHGEERGDG